MESVVLGLTHETDLSITRRRPTDRRSSRPLHRMVLPDRMVCRMRTTDRKVRDRFFKKVRIGSLPVEWYAPGGPVTPCHIWTASRDRHGYGQFHFEGKNHGAHRVAVILGGRELLEGMEVDHLCRVRACVNPEHLDLVSPLVNWERGKSPSRLNKDKTACPHGHPLTGENVYWNGKHRRCRVCRKRTNRRSRVKYKETVKAGNRTHIDGQGIIELVSSVPWLQAAKLTGWTDQTLRKRAKKTAVQIAKELDPNLSIEEAFTRSNLPPRMMSLFRQVWNQYQERI